MDVFSNFFAHILQGWGPTDPIVMEEAKLWASSLAKHAFVKWRTMAQANLRCSTPECPHPGLGACVVCRNPVCLAHSLISPAGEHVCVRCVVRARAEFGDKFGTYSGAPGGPQAPPAPGPTEVEQLAAHLKVLGLKRGATLEEVKSAFKKKAMRYHPDRVKGQDPDKRDAATEKFKQFTASYHWLMNRMNKAAA